MVDHDVVRVSISNPQDEGRHTVSCTGAGEGIHRRVVQPAWIPVPDPFVQLGGVDLDGGQLARLSLDPVDGLGVADDLDHAHLGGGGGVVSRHVVVQETHTRGGG